MFISFCYVFLLKSADEDECEEYDKRCVEHAQCFNTIGSYYCQCLSGFQNPKGHVNFTGVEGQCKGKHVYVCVRISDIYLSSGSYHHLCLFFRQI